MIYYFLFRGHKSALTFLKVLFFELEGVMLWIKTLIYEAHLVIQH